MLIHLTRVGGGGTVAAMPILSATAATIAEAARHLRSGGLVAFPTETVYGLGADATQHKAVAAIYELKGRPSFNPLIAHVADLETAERYAVFDHRARYLARRLWPGALTLVLPRNRHAPMSDLVTAGLPTLAIRVPDHPVALQLLQALGRPIAAPSANRSGKVSPTTAEHVDEEFGARLAMILDGGPTRVGLESTVLDLTGERPVLLRPGGVTRETLEASLGEVDVAAESQATSQAKSPKSPGMLLSHYAPRLPVRLTCDNPQPGEALLAFGPDVPEGFALVENLSPRGNPVEAAANLFAALRRLDQPELTGIAVMPIPSQGLGLALQDRLRRAASPR
jgi:L-threonylcarbamoyladenylate synthase